LKPFWRRRLLVPFLVLLGLNIAVFLAYTLPRRLQEKNIASRVVVLREDVERELAKELAHTPAPANWLWFWFSSLAFLVFGVGFAGTLVVFVFRLAYRM